MVNKRSLKREKIPKWPPPKELQEQVNRTVAEFCKANPHIDTLEKFEVIMERIIKVAMLPDALFQKYRNSGKTVDEVYEELIRN